MWRSKYPLQKANKGCAAKCVLYLQAYRLPRTLSVALAHYKVSHRAKACSCRDTSQHMLLGTALSKEKKGKKLKHVCTVHSSSDK